MGQRSVEAEENVWPVFVDLLSTIVMVVTFLLIVMSIAISVISQNVAKSFIESLSEKTQQGGGDVSSVAQFNASGEFAAETKPEKPDPNAKPETSPSRAESKSQTDAKAAAEGAASNPADAKTAGSEAGESKTESGPAETKPVEASPNSAGAAEAKDAAQQRAKSAQDNARFAPELAEELKASSQVDGGKELAVLSRQAIEGEKRIVVAGLDRTAEVNATTSVGKASTLLTLQFDPLGTRIDEATSAAVGAFFVENAGAIKDRPLVIWSFASTETDSVSEARRVAYYRALATRNELIKNGVAPENINVEIRFGENKETLHTVQIVAAK